METTTDEIVMYGTDWCDDCRRSKAWFDDNAIAYRYVDLDDDPEAVGVVLERNDGLKRIPVIVFGDGGHLTEPSNEALAARVAELDPGPGPAPDEPVFEVIDNTAAGRFELHRDATMVGLADYRRQGDRIVIPHVETFPEHRGQGYAALLVDGALDQIRAAGHKVVPVCPFAASHIRDNPEYHDLVA